MKTYWICDRSAAISAPAPASAIVVPSGWAGVLQKGVDYTPWLDRLDCISWTTGDGTGADGYVIDNYFDSGRYLGPDPSGIELLP